MSHTLTSSHTTHAPPSADSRAKRQTSRGTPGSHAGHNARTAHGATPPHTALRHTGLRVTAPRVAALEALQGGGHHSAEAVFAQVRSEVRGTSLQTVYGVLEAFCRVGLARKIELAGSGAALFEANHNDNHHHMVCSTCGAVEDTPCDPGEAPCLQPQQDSGFQIDRAEITFYGVCGRCRQSAA